jgi:hypothetical protein
MAGKIRLPPEAKRGVQISIGKGYRLINPNRTRGFKVAVVGKFRSMRGSFVVLRVARL